MTMLGTGPTNRRHMEDKDLDAHLLTVYNLSIIPPSEHGPRPVCPFSPHLNPWACGFPPLLSLTLFEKERSETHLAGLAY